MPGLTNIDHVHVNVRSWHEAEPWYECVLGLRRVEAFASWAVDGGPLVIENQAGSVHLALFEAPGPGSSVAAFGTDGEQFLSWKTHLEDQGIDVRIADHDLAWSLYFQDPFDNLFEITTYDHDTVRTGLEQP